MARIIKEATNSKGVKLALCHDKIAYATGDHHVAYRPSFSVLIYSGNYDGKVRGGMRYSWKVVYNGTQEEAEKIFNRRTK